VLVNTSYYTCHTCAGTFKLDWHAGQLKNYFPLSNVTELIEESTDEEELQTTAVDSRSRLLELNDQIRRLEMAKAGERLRVFAIFVVICAFIFILFRVTVEGFNAITNPGAAELGAAGAAGISLMIIAVYGLRKSAIVRKSNKLNEERKLLEDELQKAEAVLDLRSRSRRDIPSEESAEKQGEEETPQTNKSDIIGRFASRKKHGKSRLNIRDDD
jgi:hypothetical protein